MPGFDGTGPRGMGSMTGRGMAYCAVPIPPYANPKQVPPVPPYRPSIYSGRPRWGMRGLVGRGFGRGRGWRCNQ